MSASKLFNGLLLMLVLLLPQGTVAQNYFVARVTPESGTVEYRSVSGEWIVFNEVRYMVNGNAIRTQAGSTALVEIPGQQNSSRLVENSQFEVENNLVELVRGEFTNPRIVADNLMDKMQSKLQGAMSFLSARRQAPCQPVVRTARNLTVSAQFPDLVWQNACPTYSYRLTIDGETHEIGSPGEDKFVRFTVAGVEPGEHRYKVEILDNGRVVYSPSSESVFEWVGEPTSGELDSRVAGLERDVFAQTDLLEENGFLVAAMLAYRDYFQEHSEQNHLRPLLIKAYAQLGLYDLQSEEVRLYNTLRSI